MSLNRSRRNVLWMFLCLPMLCPVAVKALIPRIVNGTPTGDYPSTAFVIFYQSASQATVSGFCSGTLIGCHTVLTAGHCVCSDAADNFATCVATGIADPRTINVFLPHVGLLPVERITLHPQYEFGVQGDIALLFLAEPADAVPPAALNDRHPLPRGAKGTVVGYGTTRAGFRSVDDTGIKRAGAVSFSACPTDIPSATNVCWSFLGSGANACAGDSGGGLFLASDGPEILAGVISGGTSVDCQAPDQSFGTSVAAHLAWIREQVGSDLGSPCDSSALVGGASIRTTFWQAELSPMNRSAEWTFEVPPNAAELRVTFNGQSGSQGSFTSVNNDFDLYVLPPNTAAVQAAACEDLNPYNFGACRISQPAAGPWRIRIQHVQGQGPAQATATLLLDALSCPADCDHDGTVAVAELIRAVSIAVGETSSATCEAADLDANGQVTIDEIVRGVQAALNGCS